MDGEVRQNLRNADWIVVNLLNSMDINKVYTEGIINNLKGIIKDDISFGRERSQVEYLDKALEDLKLRYKIVNKWDKYRPWTSEFTKDLANTWTQIKPEILAAIEKFLMDYKHKKMTKDIKVATARAAISAAMKEAGLKHKFDGQTHRAKVTVLITNNRGLLFYIPYKKLYEQLPRAIESLKVIRNEIESLGSQVTINKVYSFDFE